MLKRLLLTILEWIYEEDLEVLDSLVPKYRAMKKVRMTIDDWYIYSFYLKGEPDTLRKYYPTIWNTVEEADKITFKSLDGKYQTIFKKDHFSEFGSEKVSYLTNITWDVLDPHEVVKTPKIVGVIPND